MQIYSSVVGNVSKCRQELIRRLLGYLVSHTKNCPYNIWRYFVDVKIENFNEKYLIFFLFLLKT